MNGIDQDILNGLAKKALSVRDNAYAPYSKHFVGAALLTETGQEFVGTNTESANIQVVCAENAAISAMVSAGERSIAAVVTVGGGDILCTPCGVCRQRIREFATPETRIYAADKEGVIRKTYTMDELLPDSFGPENVQEVNPDIQVA